MKGRFSLPMSQEQCVEALTVAVRNEVELRWQTYRESTELAECIRQTAQAMTSKDRFGIFFCGRCGNGKSTMMRAIQQLTNLLKLTDRDGNRLAFRMCDAREIVREYNRFYRGYELVRDCKLLAIDDLGLEPAEVMSYGNVYSPVVELLSHRYNEQLFTIITTNLQPAEVREKYGDRIADRFNEMMKTIIFKNETYRGK
ncbi:MAG: hypothetical protein NC344_07775 [Bacteroidales bacterium]|nr:hypothetical protein [Bacteroidales bacterium]MCM1147712.1 hypothetical protein [Bacteroidales bacterium]MCM1206759.1 hypothetical protein [Bacillota bacterium]MCM1510659.1 hypothetical protein [Clostridium sp.]